MTDSYRDSKALGGTDSSRMVADYEAWMFERNLKEKGTLPPWMVKETKSMSLGTIAHCALLEPEKYEKMAVLVPYYDSYAKKEGRDALTNARKRAEERSGFVVRPEEAFAIKHFRKNWEKQFLPTPDKNEVELEFYKKVHGVELKGRIDWLCDSVYGGKEVVDLKTTSDLKKTHFSIKDYRYDVQLAHYCMISDAKAASIIWLETKPPHRVRREIISSELLEKAESEAKSAWSRFTGSLL